MSSLTLEVKSNAEAIACESLNRGDLIELTEEQKRMVIRLVQRVVNETVILVKNRINNL